MQVINLIFNIKEEIDKILLELTTGALGAAPDALKGENHFACNSSY